MLLAAWLLTNLSDMFESNIMPRWLAKSMAKHKEIPGRRMFFWAHIVKCLCLRKHYRFDWLRQNRTACHVKSAIPCCVRSEWLNSLVKSKNTCFIASLLPEWSKSMFSNVLPSITYIENYPPNVKRVYETWTACCTNGEASLCKARSCPAI